MQVARRARAGFGRAIVTVSRHFGDVGRPRRSPRGRVSALQAPCQPPRPCGCGGNAVRTRQARPGGQKEPSAMAEVGGISRLGVGTAMYARAAGSAFARPSESLSAAPNQALGATAPAVSPVGAARPSGGRARGAARSGGTAAWPGHPGRPGRAAARAPGRGGRRGAGAAGKSDRGAAPPRTRALTECSPQSRYGPYRTGPARRRRNGRLKRTVNKERKVPEQWTNLNNSPWRALPVPL
jgi:hypothetical protein